MGNPIESPLDPHTVILETRRELHFLDVASIGFVNLGVLDFCFLQVFCIDVLQINSDKLGNQDLARNPSNSTCDVDRSGVATQLVEKPIEKFAASFDVGAL